MESVVVMLVTCVLSSYPVGDLTVELASLVTTKSVFVDVYWVSLLGEVTVDLWTIAAILVVGGDDDEDSGVTDISGLDCVVLITGFTVAVDILARPAVVCILVIFKAKLVILSSVMAGDLFKREEASIAGSVETVVILAVVCSMKLNVSIVPVLGVLIP